MRRSSPRRGFTLIELAVAMGLIVLLAVAGFAGFSSWTIYREQLTAEAGLNQIAAAQRAYLLEHPTQTYADLTAAALAPYLPSGSLPTMPGGSTLTITAFPPTCAKGSTTWTAKDY